MKTLVFTNQKGGVGKSTSAINVAAGLTLFEKKVLLIDMDPQANATIGIGGDDRSDISMYNCLTENTPISDAIQKTSLPGLDLIPSSMHLANAEIEISHAGGRETILRDNIRACTENLPYDYIVIDLPPSLGLLTINGLAAADGVIIPIEAGIFALSGVEQLLNIINLVRRKINPTLGIEGILLTKFDSRTNFAKDILTDINEIFKNVYISQIHQSIRIAEAQKEQMPVTHYATKSRSAYEYTEVAKELISHDTKN